MKYCPTCGQQVEGRAMKILKARLTCTQLVICCRLCERFGKLVTYNDLINTVWGLDPNGGPDDAAGNLKVHMHRIRRKLDGTGLVIHTKNRLGYTIHWEEPAMAKVA